MADNAAALLGETRHKSGNVHEVHNRNVKFVAGADKARSLVRGVDVEAAGLVGGLVSNYARHYSLESGKADYYIAGEGALYFKKFAVIDNPVYNFIYVERFF